jgi:hypothetical protein
MLFNTLSFAFFLPVVFLLYWFAEQPKLKVAESTAAGKQLLFL